MKRIYLVVRTSYDVFVKPTYALLKKERTDILRLIVRSFFVKLAPDLVSLFDLVVLFHLLAFADKIYGNHCASWSVEVLIKCAFP